MNQDEQLLGNKLERRLKDIKVNKISEIFTKVTGKPCGCNKRKEALNNLHRKIIKNNKN